MEITLEVEEQQMSIRNNNNRHSRQNDKLKIVFRLACGFCSRLRNGLVRKQRSDSNKHYHLEKEQKQRPEKHRLEKNRREDSNDMNIIKNKRRDTISQMNAGCVLIQRSASPKIERHSIEPSLAITITAKQHDILFNEKGEQKIEKEINNYLKRPRRNAVFVMTDEERTGLKLVLKHYLQAQHIRQYII